MAVNGNTSALALQDVIHQHGYLLRPRELFSMAETRAGQLAHTQGM